MKKIIMLIFLVIDVVSAQDSMPQIYFVDSTKLLVVYQSESNSGGYVGQYFSNDGIAQGESFGVYANGLSAVGFNGEILTSKTINYPGQGFEPPSFEIYGKLQKEENNDMLELILSRQHWPECGTGFLGYQNSLKAMPGGFGFLEQMNGNFKFERIFSEDNSISEYFINNYNNESLEGLNFSFTPIDSSRFYLTWFGRSLFESNGIYPYSINIAKVNVNNDYPTILPLIEYGGYNDEYIDADVPWLPLTRMVNINDSLFQLFVFEPDSMRLLSFTLNENFSKINRDTLEFSPINDSKILVPESFNISNMNNKTRTVFISFKKTLGSVDKYISYLAYYSEKGKLTGEIYSDTLSYINNLDFTVKTGEQNFINVNKIDNKNYIEFYENFSFIEKKAVNPTVSITENFAYTEFELAQNYPNPFNPATTIRYSIPVAALSSQPNDGQVVEAHRLLHVTLTIYDILGNEIAALVNDYQHAGNYEVKFNATGLASGIYICRLSVGEFSQTRKMVLLR